MNAKTIEDATGKALSGFKAFFKDVDGKPSLSRLGSAVLVITWVVLAIATRGIPERTTEFAVLVGTLMGTNALKNAAANFSPYRADDDKEDAATKAEAR